jgi:hypothetical protein
MGTTKLDSVEMAKDDLIQAVESLPDTPWMMAIWSVNPNGKLDMRRVTWEFPTAKFVKAIGMLATDLGNDGAPKSDVSPLPTVNLVDLLGGAAAPKMYAAIQEGLKEGVGVIDEVTPEYEIKTETAIREDS